MWGRAVLAAGSILLLPCAIARAGTVSHSGSTVSYQADATTAETVTVSIDSGDAVVTSDQGLTSTNDCSDDGFTATCPGTPSLFVVRMLGFDDAVDGRNVGAATSALEAHGGGGDDGIDGTNNNDALSGDDGSDHIFGHGGNDTIDGGPGPDYLDDGTGDDTITGGPGDDVLTDGAGRDIFSGGDGNDTVDYSQRTAAVTATLDGVADSGEAGEGDTIGPDVENAVTGSGNDTLVGNAGDNYLTSNEGNDNIVAGPGSDTVQSGPGDDVIDTRDGVYDSVDCGPGNDVVYADPGDGTSNCEVAPDPDGDGYIADDCNNHDPNIHPNAPEIYGNDIDEDCKDGPGYLPISAGISFKYKGSARPRGAILTALRITAVHPGDALKVTCKGKGCPYKSKSQTGTAGHSTVNLLKPFKRRVLRPRTVVVVSASAPFEIGRVVRLVVGRKGTIKNTSLCLKPHASAPAKCT